MVAKVKLSDPVLGDLSEDRLTADYWVFQRAKGHRFSVDDVATAYVAARQVQNAPHTVLDLGTGLGSVLLHLAWIFPEAVMKGIEAQDASFMLLERNVARNQLQGRVHIVHGDIRDEGVLSHVGTGFDLVTGTPPYFPEGAAIDAEDAQRTFARVEYRGGVEAYLDAALRTMAPHGTLVLCGDAHSDARVRAARGALHVTHRVDVVAKAGRPPLFSVWVLRYEGAPETHETLTLRTERGELTVDAIALRRFSGFDPPKVRT